MTTPVAGTDSIYIRLAGANRFTMRPVPVKKKIPFGGGFAVPGYSVSGRVSLEGKLQVELCASQAAQLLNWACTRINAGQTLPWTTTEPVGDLASATIYHGVARDDGTIRRRAYTGIKVAGWDLECAGEDQAAMLSLDLIGSTFAGDPNAATPTIDPTSIIFPAPAETAFPTDLYLFEHTSGQFSVASTVQVKYESFKLSVKNTLDARFFAGRYRTLARLRGRHTTLNAKLVYTPSADWRAALEALTNQAISLAFNNGVHTATVTLNAANLLDQVDDDLQPGKLYEQNVTWENQEDTAAASDITVATT